MILIPAMILSEKVRGLWPLFALYIAAKLCEAEDARLFAMLPISGHTLKHILAAWGSWEMLKWRERVGPLFMEYLTRVD